jgi:hypothetical protein
MMTKLQIPIDDSVRTKLEKRAHSLGFDSAQAYIRVWARAEADGRVLNFDTKRTVLSDQAISRYESMALDMDNMDPKEIVSYSNVNDFMKDFR